MLKRASRSTSGRVLWWLVALIGTVALMAAVRSCRKGPALPEAYALADSEEFRRQVLESDSPVLVDFFATWCPPCKVLSPRLEAIRKDYQGRAKVFKVDVDGSSELARQYGIELLPTVIAFAGGQEIQRWTGLPDDSEYRAVLDAQLHAAAQKKEEQPMAQREGVVTMKGNPVTLTGHEVRAGQKAPDFIAIDVDLNEVAFHSLPKKIYVLSSVPSLDTGVCSAQTHRFSSEAEKLDEDVEIITLSMDLPFAQKRWCGAEGVNNVRTLSDHRDASFGTGYGVLIKELRLLSRAVFVVDKDKTVRYVQIVSEITEEPDYAAALAAVHALKG